ncbi:MAG: VWA domain-containing protein [Flavisolibacter sp.]
MNFQYQYPQAFYLLALLLLFLLLFLFYQFWKKRRLQKTGNTDLIRKLFPSHSNTKSTIKFFLVLVAFAAGCLAVANPRKPDASSAEARKGIDLVIALDVSNSMLATDIAPSRLDRAKQFISKLIDNLKDDRVALIEFAGNAYMQMPLTFDQSAARLYVSTASPGAITSQGTSIGDALKKADIAFGEESDRFRSIVLITDGETHDEDALVNAKKLAQKGVMINTVGIGSVEGSTIMDTTGAPKKDENGQVVVSKLNQQLLQQLAATTNGTYIHLESAEAAVKDILSQYNQIDKKALGDTSSYTYQTFYMWPVLPMLLLLLVELFIPDRKKIKSTKKIKEVKA